jgi:membrane associated rhomboid family serine protease
MFIIPFGHDDMVLSRLPFVTIGIIAICLIVYFPTSHRIEKDARKKAAAAEQADKYFQEHDYLKLPDSLLAKMPKTFVEIYDKRQEWVAWYLESPDEVAAFLGDKPEVEIDRKPVLHTLDELFEAVRSMPGSRMAEIGDVQKDIALSTESKRGFLERLSVLGPARIMEEQGEIDRLAGQLERIDRESLLKKLAYRPSHPKLVGLVAHQFLHGGLLHLIFNMLFLWIAAIKLEDIWTRPVFLCAYLICGIAGALAHGLAHPDSTVPLIGASGAVAGLMGAFLNRLTRTELHFFYAYWLIRLTPRWGTFKAPAYLMLPIWFVGELGSAFLFSGEQVAYWSHVGGFATGAVIALAFKLFKFEERVLGREPEVRVKPEAMPLIAFQPPPGPRPEPAEADEKEAALPSSLNRIAPSPIGTRHAFRELKHVRVSKQGLECTTSHGESVTLTQGNVGFVIAGRVDRIDSKKAREYFSTSEIPAEPALLLAVVKPVSKEARADVVEGFLIDGAKLGYMNLLGAAYPSRQKNFTAFAKLLLGLFPKARYITGPGPLAEHNLPIYSNLEEFFERLGRAVSSEREPRDRR